MENLLREINKIKLVAQTTRFRFICVFSIATFDQPECVADQIPPQLASAAAGNTL